MARNTPKFHRHVQALYPEYCAAVEALGTAARNAGPLAEKTVHFVQLAAAAATRSEGAVHSHVRRALKLGASPEEIRHALICITSTIGFPNVSAALSWAEDVLAPDDAGTPSPSEAISD